MSPSDFPQVGDLAVDLWTNGRPNGKPDRAGDVVTVKDVLTTLVITSDGERYARIGLHPISEGRYSARKLVPATDPRVLVVRGRDHLTEMARLTDNLAKLDYKTPEDVVAALMRIVAATMASRNALIGLMRDATRSEQEGGR